MVEILLLIALVVAILLDIIRVIQYIQMRKAIALSAKDALIGKIGRLISEWANGECKVSFLDYIREHWEDDKE